MTDCTVGAGDDDWAEALATVRSLTFLTIEGKDLSDDDLRQIATLPRLHSLYIHGPNKITQTGLVELRNLDQLESLRLGWLVLGDDELEAITQIKGLKRLDLAHAVLSRSGLSHLSRMTTLEDLSLDDSFATEEDVAVLEKKLPNCTINHYDFLYEPGIESIKLAHQKTSGPSSLTQVDEATKPLTSDQRHRSASPNQLR